MADTQTVILQGSVTIGDMDTGGAYGKIYNKGKKMTSVASINTLDPAIYKGSTKMWANGEACHIFFGDIKRQWQTGGLILQGSVTIDDMDSTITYGDINRNWHVGGQVIQGSVTLNDMDTTIAYGDIKREWGNMLYDDTVTDINGYMRYDDFKFNFTSDSTDLTSNAVTYFLAEPNIQYRVTMNMDTRFRLWSYNGVPTSSGLVMDNHSIHSLDTNTTTSQNGTSQTLTITTGTNDDRVFIGYWASGGARKRTSVRNSIVVSKVYWTQPVMTEDVAVGGAEFGTECDSVIDSGGASYHAFDGVAGQGDHIWHSNNTSYPHWITFYNPKPLKVENLICTNNSNSYTWSPKDITVQGSNDNTTWTDLLTTTNSMSNQSQSYVLQVNSTAYYKYHRLYITSGCYSSDKYISISEIQIKALEQV